MNTQSKETPEDGNQRRKSIGSGGGSGSGSGSGSGGGSSLAGGKTRQYSIGIASSQKSFGEEGNNVPNYLRASTGSCHDFCKFGKKEPTLKPATSPEILTPAEPVKVTKKVVSLPSKKPQVLKMSSSTNGKATKNELNTLQRSTSLLKTSPGVVTRDASSKGSNGGITKIDIKTVKKTGMTPKAGHIKKDTPKATLNESQSPKASFSRSASLKPTNRGVKQVSPLKDQNRMQKIEPKQTTDDKVQTKTMHGVEAEREVKPETIEFDFMQSSMESINHPLCNSSESLSGKKIVEQESVITHPVSESSELFSDKELLQESLIAPAVVESSELFLDKELLEESLIAPAVVESSQSCSDEEVLEEESLIAPPVSESSESFYDDEVLEGESEYTDDEEVEVEVSDGSETEVEVEVSEGSETADVNEMETSVGNHKKIPRKGRMVISEDKEDKAVKLRFRRGKIIDIQSENNGPRRLKFRRKVTEGNEDGQSIAIRTYKNKTLDLQTAINGPRKLKFTKGQVTEGNEDKQRVSRRSFEKKFVEEEPDCIIGPESVVLKHQGEQEKKDAQGLFNNVIEETASKLVESRKSKVKALVGAFETVISLQDGKPSST